MLSPQGETGLLEIPLHPLKIGCLLLRGAQHVQLAGGTLQFHQVDQKIEHRPGGGLIGHQRGVLRLQEVGHRKHALGIGIDHQIEVFAGGIGCIARLADAGIGGADGVTGGADALLDLLPQRFLLVAQLGEGFQSFLARGVWRLRYRAGKTC